ncbi:MAG: alpha-amylase, partial [Anaerolineaceae bacterium]
TGEVDLLAPDAPTGLTVSEGNAQLTLTWNASADAVGYNIYRSQVSGGGWIKQNTDPLAELTYPDTAVENTRRYYSTVTALDSAGNESATAQEASGMPHLTIGWANLQWPPTMNHTISMVVPTDTAYGQVWIDGATNQPGATPGLIAQLGFGPEGTDPARDGAWTWISAAFNVDAGNNDEFKAQMLPEAVGTYDYVYRYSVTGGTTWTYADLNGPFSAGSLPPNPGKLTVIPAADTTPPTVPGNLHVVSASPSGIDLAWDASTDDQSLYGYEVLRGNDSGGPYTQIARITATSYTDTAIGENATYFYVVRALDIAINRSGNSNEVTATSAPRTVTLNFNVTVPDTTDATGRSVYIAGFLDRLDGNLPQWNPAGVVLTRVDATHWTITLTGKESVQIEYKYALGDWDHVEKDAACGEISNRMLTLSYGADGVMNINDTVTNWRNVSPCGN